MQTVQFLSNSDASASMKVAAPIVHQSKATIAVGAGATPSDLLAVIVAGECAAYGGQIVNKGCNDVKATITYIDGGACESGGCAGANSADYETLDVDVIIPANSVFPLPLGFHQGIKVSTVDVAGVAFANTSESKLDFYASYQPSCGGCVKAI